MANVYDVKADILVKALAEKLKASDFKKPEYVDYVKSGAGRDRLPQDRDFWYMRGASILRQIYIRGPVGVGRLRNRYGNRKESVVHKKHHVKAGGSIIRDAMMQLESMKLVEKAPKGRVITAKGRSFVDKTCNEILQNAK
ncbi:MAG: 30S ribosomal protein S19e [Candidatus Micrarchaeaceae archaeon]